MDNEKQLRADIRQWVKYGEAKEKELSELRQTIATKNLQIVSLKATTAELRREAEYWKSLFLNVTNYWYDKETPNMERQEFINTKIGQSKQPSNGAELEERGKGLTGKVLLTVWVFEKLKAK